MTQLIQPIFGLVEVYNLEPQGWLPRKDSNLDKEIQNLSCYHYTTRHAEERAKLRSCFCASDDAVERESSQPLAPSELRPAHAPTRQSSW